MAQPLNPDLSSLGGSKDIGKEEMINLLGEDDNKETELLPLEGKEEVEEVEEKEEEEEEPKQTVEDEIEEELKEPSEEDLELMTPVRRKEILTKYPNLFKDFPYLEKAYYREQQFTELFPTIPEAREAAENSKIMQGFEQQIIHGANIGIVFEAVKEEDPEAFNKVIDNLLPSIQKVDSNAYYHILGNVIKSTIVSMLHEARNAGENGEPLQAAAHLLNQFVFGSNKFEPPQKLSRQPEGENPKEQELKQREQQIIQGQFETARDDLQGRVDNTLKATIAANIDPKKSMTEYVRKNAERDAFDELEKMVNKDARFKSVLDKLWERAFQNQFNRESMDRIRSAYLSKCKTLLPTAIKKARNDALKGVGKRSAEDHRGPITPGRPAPQNSGKRTGDIPRGMKTLDFLMQD